MLRTCCFTVFTIFTWIGAATAGNMAPGQVTLYTDAAGFFKALAPLGPVTIGPYTGKVTETIISTTAETDSGGFCCAVIGNSSTVSPGQFNDLSWIFDQLGDAMDGNCFAVPDCTLTEPTELILTFSPKLDAFFSIDTFIENTGEVPQINGEPLPLEITVGFFGAIGPAISSLDFTLSNILTDDPSQIVLPDIIVAQAVRVVDEPPVFACFGAAVLMLAFGRLWRTYGMAVGSRSAGNHGRASSARISS